MKRWTILRSKGGILGTHSTGIDGYKVKEYIIYQKWLLFFHLFKFSGSCPLFLMISKYLNKINLFPNFIFLLFKTSRTISVSPIFLKKNSPKQFLVLSLEFYYITTDGDDSCKLWELKSFLRVVKFVFSSINWWTSWTSFGFGF